MTHTSRLFVVLPWAIHVRGGASCHVVLNQSVYVDGQLIGLFPQETRLQALVYDNLPPTTAVTDQAIGLEKLSLKARS